MINKIDKDMIIIGILFVLSLFVIYLITTTNPGEYPEEYMEEYTPLEENPAYNPPEDENLYFNETEQALNEMEQALNESDNYNISEMEKDIQMLENTLENVSQSET